MGGEVFFHTEALHVQCYLAQFLSRGRPWQDSERMAVYCLFEPFFTHSAQKHHGKTHGRELMRMKERP